MNRQEEMAEILARAERDLRGLIEQALAEQRYRDVARIAAIADKQADLLAAVENGAASDGHGASGGARSHEPVGEQWTAEGDVREEPRRATPNVRSADYPKFEREGDRLVKIGWSKKDRRTYEHRAPRDAVMAFAARVNEKAADGRVFTMDDVLPVQDGEGNEVPTYQAYLALAWLRNVGVIERKGKNGYVLHNGPGPAEGLSRYWNELTER